MSVQEQLAVAIAPIAEAADAEIASLNTIVGERDATILSKDETISALHDELALTAAERDALATENTRLKGVIVNKNARIENLQAKLQACKDGAGSFN